MGRGTLRLQRHGDVVEKKLFSPSTLGGAGRVDRACTPSRTGLLPRVSYPIICALEVLAAEESFGQLDGAAIERLREVNREYQAAFEKQDIAAGISRNHRFHDLLSAGSSNQRLRSMLDELRSKVESLEIWAFSHINEWADSIAQHEEILAAIEAGNLGLAMEVLKKNRLATYRDYQENDIPVAKVQVSAAWRCDNSDGVSARANLAQYAETVYLHQTAPRELGEPDIVRPPRPVGVLEEIFGQSATGPLRLRGDDGRK